MPFQVPQHLGQGAESHLSLPLHSLHAMCVVSYDSYNLLSNFFLTRETLFLQVKPFFHATLHKVLWYLRLSLLSHVAEILCNALDPECYWCSPPEFPLSGRCVSLLSYCWCCALTGHLAVQIRSSQPSMQDNISVGLARTRETLPRCAMACCLIPGSHGVLPLLTCLMHLWDVVLAALCGRVW